MEKSVIYLLKEVDLDDPMMFYVVKGFCFHLHEAKYWMSQSTNSCSRLYLAVEEINFDELY